MSTRSPKTKTIASPESKATRILDYIKMIQRNHAHTAGSLEELRQECTGWFMEMLDAFRLAMTCDHCETIPDYVPVALCADCVEALLQERAQWVIDTYGFQDMNAADLVQKMEEAINDRRGDDPRP